MTDFDFEDAPSGGGLPSNVIPFRSAAAASGPAPAAGSGSKPADYLAGLNDRQREAVLITEGPLMVLAGAGSGKTKMLTSRIAYLIEAKRVPAYQILAVTFTNKAAGEMKERVQRHLQGHGALGNPEIGTFHAVCVRILRREMAKTPFTKQFVIYDDSDQLALVKGSIQKLGIDDKAFSPKAMQAAINRAKCDALGPEEIQPQPHNVFEKQFKRVYEQYQKDLFANNALDFGEILTMTYRILRDNEDTRSKYQRIFRYIHVDEYQDTNRAQYLILTLLASKRYGGHENICVVGDEDQSIYKWRGADIRNILDFESDYPGAKVVKLEQNYRSTQTIIKAAGQVIRNNRSRKDKTLWTDNEEGLPVVRAQLPDERSEAEMVVSEIKRLAANEGRAYGDFAVFYRTHAQSRQFEDILRREKIPYQIVGGLRFYDRKEIKDILSYFRVVLNPQDSISLKRIINVPGRGIGKTTIDRLEAIQAELEQQGAADKSLWAAVQLAARDPSYTSAGTARKLAQFSAFIDRLIVEQPKLMLSELYHLILDETAYVRDLRQENTEESLGRIENLEEFDTLLQEFEEDIWERTPENEREARKPELLATFIEQSSLASVADEGDINQSVVNLMSLHSSKGLEFPVVFLVGMEEGLFPSIRPWEETPEEEIEEERRLCYVGMTRARENLYLTHVAVRRLWGNVTYQEPARFFAEIPANLVEFKDFTQSPGPSRFRVSSARHVGYQNDSGASQRPVVPPRGDDDYSQLTPENELVGSEIDHPDYGIGRIVAAEGSGLDQKVVVEFKGRDRRKFVLKYIRQYLE